MSQVFRVELTNGTTIFVASAVEADAIKSIPDLDAKVRAMTLRSEATIAKLKFVICVMRRYDLDDSYVELLLRQAESFPDTSAA